MSTSHTRSPSACLSWSAAWVRSAQQRPLVMTPLGGVRRAPIILARVLGSHSRPRHHGPVQPKRGKLFRCKADPLGHAMPRIPQPGVPDAAVDAPSGGRMRGIPAGWLQRARCTPRHAALLAWALRPKRAYSHTPMTDTLDGEPEGVKTVQETRESRCGLVRSAQTVSVPHLHPRGSMPYEAQDWLGPWTCALRLLETWSETMPPSSRLLSPRHPRSGLRRPVTVLRPVLVVEAVPRTHGSSSGIRPGLSVESGQTASPAHTVRLHAEVHGSLCSDNATLRGNDIHVMLGLHFLFQQIVT